MSAPAEPRPGLGGDPTHRPRPGLASTAGRAFRLLALTAFALHLAAGAWSALGRSAQWVAAAYEHRRETHQESRRRAFGLYARGLELAEGWIPPGEPYVLINDSDTGEFMLLQGDLAPRLALYTGPASRRLPSHWRERGIPDHAPQWVVIFHGTHRAPTVMTTQDYAAQVWPSRP